MSLKDILVYVNNSKACPKRIDAAMQLARKHNTHLFGLYVLPWITLPPRPYAAAVATPEDIDDHITAARKHADDMRAHFISAADAMGVSCEWQTVEGELAESINLHARYVDLVMIGQAEDDDPFSVTRGFVDRVLMECGRPVLIIPNHGKYNAVAKRVLIAWNTSREAVRALNDALPLLSAADKIDVLSIGKPEKDSSYHETNSNNICAHLLRHGLQAEAFHTDGDKHNVGKDLCTHASNRDIDLIVMGAYGHSRFREIVLGGATKYLLTQMTIPALMSH